MPKNYPRPLRTGVFVFLLYSITHSMSRAGTPTDNAAMEAINGWIKAEMFTDFHVTGERPVVDEIAEYIHFLMNSVLPIH